MGAQVVTELVIDSAKAVTGAEQYAASMDSAAAAAQRGLGAMSDAATKAKDAIGNIGASSLNVGPVLVALGLGAGGATVAFIGLAEAVQKYSSGLAEMSLHARRANQDVEDFQKKQFAGQLQGLS